MQECRYCQKDLPDEAFGKNRTLESGLMIYCRECMKAKRVESGAQKPDGWIRKTADMKAYQREWRKRNLERERLYEKRRDPLKRAAKAAVKYAVKTGRLVPLPCEVCGEKAQAHHPSYDRPLMVVWLCAEHHREAHALTKERTV